MGRERDESEAETERQTYEVNRSFDMFDKSRGALVVSDVVHVVSPKVLRLHHTVRITTVHLFSD